MDIVKKNLVSIICGVVALIATFAVFIYPLDGFFDELIEKAKARAAVQQKISTLVQRPRTMPVIDPSSSVAAKLPKFPSDEIIKLGRLAQSGVHTESAACYTKAVELNRKGHDLVVPESLPVVTSQTLAINYRRLLQEALNKLRDEELVAGVPPTKEQFEKRAAARKQELAKDLIIIDGVETNKAAIEQRYKADLVKLPDLMKQEMATKYKMYVDPSKVMMVPTSIPANGSSADPAAIWWAQVNFWVTRDVVDAIKEMNDKSANVVESPVKNLLSLTIPESFFPGMPGMGGMDTGAPKPTAGAPNPTVPLVEEPSLSPTKRISNNLFDVVHFQLALDIEADKVPLFLKRLATDRFITVTRFELAQVDPQLKQINGYVYGNRLVVTLKLDCEALFMREWTMLLMPKPIREALGIPDPAAAKPAAPI